MALATFNRNAIQAAAGQIFVVATPATLVGATVALKVTELFALFYANGDTRNTLKGGANPWAVLDKSGFKAKIVTKEIKIDPNDGPEEVIGWESVAHNSEITILDVDVDHLKDVLSATAAQVLATASAAGVAGRSTLLAGGQRNPVDYALLYRYPAGKKYPGEFRNILIPCCTLSLDGDTEYSKGKAIEAKIKVDAKAFSLLLDPSTNLPVVWLEDTVTAAAS